jgi:Radical SAM superfamily
MLFIHKTVSLCDHCYRHIPGNVVEEDNQIKLIKRCPEHGEITAIVEIDKEFYYGLEHQGESKVYNQVLFEATDRCQLNCPHCYHLPNNKIVDKPIADIIKQVSSFPKDCRPMLAGAEPSLRPDFIELCKELKALDFEAIDVLTNGIRFGDYDFAMLANYAGLYHAAVGLNHWSYQGKKVHNKQLKAIKNMIDLNYMLDYVGYTIETLDHIPDILTEIESLKSNRITHFRIRCGSFIGRSNDQQRSYLSNLVKTVETYYGSIERIGPDDNPYHVMIRTPQGAIIRLIQWPDVTNIDMEELNVGPWCQFYDGPVTNFVHQVITRDAYKNMGRQPLDKCPSKYHYKSFNELGKDYWKNNWTGPLEVEELDWTINRLGVVFPIDPA